MDNIDWSKNEPAPDVTVPKPRSTEEIQDLLDQLQANPGRWAVYSTHKTRNAARQRLTALRKSATYGERPLQWRTRRVEPGNVESPVNVLVNWNESPDATEAPPSA